MKKHIAEELPARKHTPAAEAPSSEKGGGEVKKEGGKTPEKRVKQAIYDIRYRARREELPLRSAYSQYMQNSSMSQQEKTMVKQKLFGKDGIQAENFNIEDLASSSVANALFKVFVEGVEEEQEPIRLTYMEKLETSEHKKYKVRVTGKDGRSYVRYADRQKISELRANSNIESVEMTGYGEPYEGEMKKGKQTARAKAGKALDPVGREDKDIDNDRDHDKTDKYLLNRRKVRGAAIDNRSGVKEEFLTDANDGALNPDANEKKIDVMKGKNTVKVNPEAPGTQNGRSNYGMQLAHYDMGGNRISEAQAKFFGMLQEKSESEQQQKLFGLALSVKRGETPRSEVSAEVIKIVDTMSEKKIRDFAKTKHEGLPKKVAEETVTQADKKAKKEMEEKDPRCIPTAVNLAKNYARAMGAKNPIVMVSTEETEMIDERARARKGQSRPDPTSLSHRVMMDIRNRNKEGLMTRSGKTVAKHEEERGVKKEPGAPTPTGETTADRLEAKKRKAEIAKAAAQRAQDMYKPRAGESD